MRCRFHTFITIKWSYLSPQPWFAWHSSLALWDGGCSFCRTAAQGCEEGISRNDWDAQLSIPRVSGNKQNPPFILGVFYFSLGRLARKILVICQSVMSKHKGKSHHCYCCLEGPWSKPEPCKLPPWFRKGLTTQPQGLPSWTTQSGSQRLALLCMKTVWFGWD